jgi:hypothetical protein
MNKPEQLFGEKLQIQENFYMNFNLVRIVSESFFDKYDAFRIGLDS